MSTPFIRFPGVAGNYVSTLDHNLWDADSAHCQQSIGGHQPGLNCSVALSSDQALYGTNSCKVTATAAGASVVNQSVGTRPAVSPLTQYSAVSWVYVSQSTEDFRVDVLEYDAGQVFVKANSGTGHSIPAGVWTAVNNDGWTTGGSTAFVSFDMAEQSAGAGDVWYLDQLCLNLGPTGVFLPSLRIVGSSFVSEAASVTPVTYTFSAGSPLVLGEGYSGDVRQWALHDGPDASAPAVAQMLALDAARATVL